MIITPLKVTGSIYRSDQELMWEPLIRRFPGRGIYVYTHPPDTQTNQQVTLRGADTLSHHHYKEDKRRGKIFKKSDVKIFQKMN